MVYHLKALGTISYSFSIVTMAVSLAMSKIFHVTIALSCTVFELFDVE